MKIEFICRIFGCVNSLWEEVCPRCHKIKKYGLQRSPTDAAPSGEPKPS